MSSVVPDQIMRAHRACKVAAGGGGGGGGLLTDWKMRRLPTPTQCKMLKTESPACGEMKELQFISDVFIQRDFTSSSPDQGSVNEMRQVLGCNVVSSRRLHSGRLHSLRLHSGRLHGGRLHSGRPHSLGLSPSASEGLREGGSYTGGGFRLQEYAA